MLPPDIGDFTGRERALDRLVGELTPGPRPRTTGPVAVVSGAGGVGKTVFAVRAAHRLAPHYPDGQLHACLAERSTGSVGAVLDGFLRALGVAPAAIPESLEERASLFRTRLGNRRLLLLLDQVAADQDISVLVPGTPTCAVIATTRGNLAQLPGATRTSLQPLPPHECADLLRRIVGGERIRREPEAAEDLLSWCARLPLAIRIAGARLINRPHWRISDLSERLRNSTQRLDELSFGNLAVRATIDVSYAGLQPQAERLLRLMAMVPVPSVASWLAAAVLGVDIEEAEDLMEELVDARLVGAERLSTTGAVRYHLHDLVRLFADEQRALREPTTEQQRAMRNVVIVTINLARHAHRCLYGGNFTAYWSLLTPAEPAVTAEHAAIAAAPIVWLEAERDVLRAGVEWAAATDHDELAWDLATASETLYEGRARFEDWRVTAQLALETCQRLGNIRGEAAMLGSQGGLAVFRHRYDEAGDLLHRSGELFEAMGDVGGAALAARDLAFLDRQQGRTQQALDSYLRLRGVFADAGDAIAKVHVEQSIASILTDRGKDGDAEDLMVGALQTCRDLGSRRAEAQVLHRLGEIHLAADSVDRAADDFARALRIVERAGDQVGCAYALLGIGTVELRRERWQQAGSVLQDANRIACEVNDLLLVARIEFARADLAAARGELAAGGLHLAHGEQIARSLGAWELADREALRRGGPGPASRNRPGRSPVGAVEQ